jgi:peptidoglycan/xylan/chitin deacetylase (PgdA/CDA1 family)
MLRNRPLSFLMVVGALPMLITSMLLVQPFRQSQPEQPVPTVTAGTVRGTTFSSTPTDRPDATAEPSPVASPTTAATPTMNIVARHQLGYVPILMYHYVRVVDEEEDPLGFRLSIRPDRFAEQMDWIAEAGYTPMTMRDLADCLRGLNECPEQPMALTFDDGYLDQLENALPELQRHGFAATFYIATGLIGEPGYMDWDDLAILRDAGMEIGAHTVNHADLTGMTLSEAAVEIIQSRRELEAGLAIEVASFSYPAGSYNGDLAALVHQVGFSNAVSTYPGSRTRQLYHLPRRRVLGGETIAGYPWYFVPLNEQ